MILKGVRAVFKARPAPRRHVGQATWGLHPPHPSEDRPQARRPWRRRAVGRCVDVPYPLWLAIHCRWVRAGREDFTTDSGLTGAISARAPPAPSLQPPSQRGAQPGTREQPSCGKGSGLREPARQALQLCSEQGHVATSEAGPNWGRGSPCALKPEPPSPRPAFVLPKLCPSRFWAPRDSRSRLLTP